MELRHLRYFVVLAEELNFSRAAKRLHIAQPPLSQQIRKLEEELGVQLFVRTKRSVRLTDAGEVFLEEALKVLKQAESATHAAQRAQRGEIGRLSVGFVGSAAYELLPRALRLYRTRFPGVELSLHQLTTTEQVHALHSREIDAGFLRPPVHDPTLSLEAVLREPLVAALPQTHRLADRKTIRLTELANEDFILYPRHLGPGTHDQIVSLCQRAGFSPRIGQEAVEMQTIVGLVAAGLGVSLVPASVEGLRSKDVVYKRMEDHTPDWEIAVVWRKQEDSSARLQKFLKVVRIVGTQL